MPSNGQGARRFGQIRVPTGAGSVFPFDVMSREVIRIVGARQHNLKNLTLEIPRNRLVVVTGPSGSGKSSLAFDTLFAEGQRKYVESLSVYARQFLDQLEKPEVDHIEGLSPAIAIEQRGSAANPRSTIATTTEIYDYLRLLYAHLGRPHDPETGEPMVRETAGDIASTILQLPAGSRVLLLAPVVTEEKGEFRDVLERLAREGFVRARVDGQFVELVANRPVRLDAALIHSVDVVVDRLVLADGLRPRLMDSLETALKWGGGRVVVLHQPGKSAGETWTERAHSTGMRSMRSGRVYETATAQHFSFNSPKGACPVCHGLGQKRVFDASLVVPDGTKSLAEGAVHPYRRLGGKRMVSYYQGILKGMAQHYGASMDAPWNDLPEEFRERMLRGTGSEPIDFWFKHAGTPRKASKPFEGVMPNLDRLYAESESEFTRNRLKAYMTLCPCDACGGRRLRPESLAITLGSELIPGTPVMGSGPPIPGMSIAAFCALPISRAATFLDSLVLDELQKKIAGEVITEIRKRLGFMEQVGLGYLTLDREFGTLSGGEAQRIRLATQLGAGLVGVLYILDEPSIGLHPRDNERLLQTIRHLRDLGNSVLVVEHDEETIRQADHVLDLGPGAGVQGGELVAQGTPEEIMAHPRSVTGRYLSGELRIELPRRHNDPSAEKGWLEVLGCRENNLAGIDARFPLGTLICVTGVSGSGKSTLVEDILRRALFRQWYGSKDRPGQHREIRGAELLEKCVVVDQAPIGRTPRSNPATYTGIFNEIRDLFSSLPASRVRGYGPGRFSFNVRGGRCEKCEGDGMLKIEMHFLPPVYVTCDVCGGRRYNRETLEMTYKGLNIADVLNLTVDEAVGFFRALPKLHDPCRTLAEVGLGYLKLGQAGTTLSGGEAQRLKLAAELARRQAGRTLYLLDEPTTGLHFQDIARLVDVMFRLRDTGNTLIVIEHNLDVIKVADWIIDLGPEGGAGGGRILAEGTPEAVARVEESHTGRHLRRVLRR